MTKQELTGTPKLESDSGTGMTPDKWYEYGN